VHSGNLKNIKWTKYLEREQELFIFAAFMQTYGQLLKQETGFGFEKQLHYYNDTKGIFYKDPCELQACNKHFTNIIENEPQKVSKWIQKEQEIQKKQHLLLQNKNPIQVVNNFQKLLLYNTVIPYRILAAIQYSNLNKQNLKKKLEKIRSKSLYLTLFENMIKPLLHKVHQKINMPKNLLSMMTPKELIMALEKGILPSKIELKKRKNGCHFHISKNKIQFYYNKLDITKNTTKLPKKLSGNIAFQGKSKGEVSIVNNLSQLANFQKGNILISINTNPALISAISKASAIITDEGGFMCHAAIIARELKIPCIIGTKHATRIFKNGDMIEVNAIKGIVKKIHLE
jgi:phosphoenolpyruvate synthase/pyruvate phosphate dikinase